MRRRSFRTIGTGLAIAGTLWSQQPAAQQAPAQTTQQPPATPAQTAPAQTAPAQQTAPPQAAPAQTNPGQMTPVAAPQSPPPATTPAAPPAPAPLGGMNLQNASLTEVIDMLARSLHLNYILDPRVKGSVTLNTYGEIRTLDQRTLLDLILRLNNATMVPYGDVYRIVPLADVSHMPLAPQVDPKLIPEDDRTTLNMIFLKYASADEIASILKPFLGEGATMYAYPPANLLFILDSNRNMRRNIGLISLFDNDALAGQRVRTFEVKNSRPSDLVKDLDAVFKSLALSEKNAPIRFLPLDRINTIIVTASNPSAFPEVQKWIDKLDIPVKVSAGGLENYIYRVKYGRAESIASSLMQLYGGFGMGGGGMGYGSQFAGGYGASYAGITGGGSPFGGGYPGMGMGYPGAAGGFPGVGMDTAGNAVTPTAPVTPGATVTPGAATSAVAGQGAAGTVTATGRTTDLTGSYMGNSMYGSRAGMPRIIPRLDDNSILIQATAQQYASILKLLEQMDISPRQVLIQARIYEVSLTNALSYSGASTLQPRGTTSAANGSGRDLLASLSSAGLNLSQGWLVSKSKELLASVQAIESTGKAKTISAPDIIATDSIPASINVGQDVPVLTAQAVTGAQVGGTSVFANSVSTRSTGVTLNIKARVTPGGVVTMEINQEVSSPEPSSGTSGIDSPSFSRRAVQTQVTVQDGDTIAIGGFIQEVHTNNQGGVPGLSHIPYVGGLFGSRSTSRSRTELIVFLTPKVIYDTNSIVDASEELRSRMRMLRKDFKE